MKLKDITNFLWVGVAGVVLFFLYKIFCKPTEQDVVDDAQRLGLTKEETYGITKVHSIIEEERSFSRQLLELITPYNPYFNMRDITVILNKVVHKDLFGKTYLKLYGVSLQADIIDAFGNDIYNVMTEHVDEFYMFC